MMAFEGNPVRIGRPVPSGASAMSLTNEESRGEMECSQCGAPVERPARNRFVLENDDETGLVDRRVIYHVCAACWADVYDELAAGPP